MQQQKSLADLKKKNAQLRKKDRRKKRAFRQKTQPILDVASSFANHQVVQTQVKQDSKTAGEVFSAVHNQTAKRQANDSAEDKKNAELNMVQKQMETALLHNEQMGLLQDRAKQHRAVTTEALINGAAEAFRKLSKGFEALSDAKKNALKTFTEEYERDQRMLKDLQDRLAAAENAGDREAAAALLGQIQNVENDLKGKLEQAERDFKEGTDAAFQNLAEQKSALKDLGDAIANLDAIMKEGYEKIMGALDKALEAAKNAQPCLDTAPITSIYWCLNQVNYCRGSAEPTDWGSPGACHIIQLTDKETRQPFSGPAAYFCHEGSLDKDFGEQADTSKHFSKLWELPNPVLKRMLTTGSKAKQLGVSFSGWSEEDLQKFRVKNNNAYYQNKIRNALKVFFPNSSPEAETIRNGDDGANAYNKLLYTAILEAFEYVIKNGCT